MSQLNKTFSPLSISSEQTGDSMSTTSIASDSDASDEFLDTSPNQARAPPVFTLSDRCIDDIFPVRSFTLVEVPRSNQGSSPFNSICSDQGQDGLSPVIDFTEAEVFGPYRNKQYSPAASYNSMKSDESMKPPLKFRRDSDVMESIDELSSTSTLVSVQSEESMEPPHTINCSESYTSLMMSEHLRCSLCKYIFKEPVTVPCGHSFCKNCITYYWIKTAPKSSYHCPQCRKTFKTRPVLNLNFTLANVVQTQQQVKISAAFSTQSYTGPVDVTCDSCSGSKLKAVKSCLTCRKSFCETHVRQHYTLKALSKHTLTDTKNIYLKQEVYMLDQRDSHF